MAISLTDMSTETFWESDEEDRNKSKVIEISMNKLSYVCKMIYVHIDNSRDIQNKVSNVVFYAGQSLGDTNLIKSVEVDSKSNTWISAYVRGVCDRYDKVNRVKCKIFMKPFHFYNR